MPSPVLADTGTKDVASAPVFRNQLILGKLLFYTFNICTWFINLVDGNDDLNTSSLCMADSLLLSAA